MTSTRCAAVVAGDRTTERFIDFQQWTTARKTVLLMVIALAPQLLLSAVAYAAAQASGIVDTRHVSGLLVTGCLAVVALLAVALVEVRRGRTTANPDECW